MIYRVITAKRQTGEITSQADYLVRYSALLRAYNVEEFFPDIESIIYECENRDDKGKKIENWRDEFNDEPSEEVLPVLSEDAPKIKKELKSKKLMRSKSND